MNAIGSRQERAADQAVAADAEASSVDAAVCCEESGASTLLLPVSPGLVVLGILPEASYVEDDDEPLLKDTITSGLVSDGTLLDDGSGGELLEERIELSSAVVAV